MENLRFLDCNDVTKQEKEMAKRRGQFMITRQPKPGSGGGGGGETPPQTRRLLSWSFRSGKALGKMWYGIGIGVRTRTRSIIIHIIIEITELRLPVSTRTLRGCLIGEGQLNKDISPPYWGHPPRVERVDRK
jgi:hypothetical protein